jgi:hypothetical protein
LPCWHCKLRKKAKGLWPCKPELAEHHTKGLIAGADPESDREKARVAIATQMLSQIKLGEDFDANNFSLKLAFEDVEKKNIPFFRTRLFSATRITV